MESVLNIVFFLPIGFALGVTIEPVSERIWVCPGDTTNYVCTDEGQLAVTWSILCYENSMSSRNSGDLPHSIGATRSTPQNSTYCGILFTYNFVQGVSDLNVTIPLSRGLVQLLISCQLSQSKILQVKAAPPVFNLTYLPNHSIFTGPVATVTLMWSAAAEELAAEDIEYTLTISTDSTHTTHTTKLNSWTTQLEFQTYLVSVYSSTCHNAIVSDDIFITNITIESLPSCDLLMVPPGVVASSVDGDGSAITYQCGEGLVAEGQSLQALCGADRNWSTDLIVLTCRDRENNLNESDVIYTTSDNSYEINATVCSEAKEPAYNGTLTISMTTFILTTVGVSVIAAVLCSAIAFTVGIFTGIRKSKNTNEMQVSALATSSNPGKAHEVEVEYEEINNLELKDILTTGNVAYGTKP